MKLLFNTRSMVGRSALALVIVSLSGCVTSPLSTGGTVPRDSRTPRLGVFGSPAGVGVCYGAYRSGQSPWGVQPTREQILEDLGLLARHFVTLRTYSSTGSVPRDMLEIIRDERLGLRVLLGVWIEPEVRRDERGAVAERLTENVRANAREAEAGIELAREFPGVVAGVIVGNETQVFWSGHRVDEATLVEHIRRVRTACGVPVTTADDFRFWEDPASHAVAREVDFIVTHAYAMWNGALLDDAIEFTERSVAAVRAMHPGRLVVLGETGWATRKHNEGEQATLIRGEPGEAQQSRFFRETRAWARDTRTPVFFFEAFDEPWKGGSHPDEVEKHWGLYGEDRRPKRALIEAFGPDNARAE